MKSTFNYYRLYVCSLLILCLTFPVAAQSPSEGLYAAYNFDEGSGTVLRDQSGNNRNGTITNPDWIMGISGRALNFSREASGNPIKSSTSLPTSTTIGSDKGSFSAWIKTEDISSTMGIMFSGSPASTGFGNGDVQEVNVRSATVGSTQDKAITVYTRLGPSSSTGRNIFLTTTTPKVNDNSWHHVVATWLNDGTSQTIQVYVDGLLTGTSNTNLALASYRFTSRIFLGRVAGTTTRGYNGLMDEVRLYSRVLDPTEVSLLAQIPAPFFL